MGQGQMLHEAVHRRSLRTVLAHKLQPGGGVVKQVPDRDGGALRRTGGLHCAGHTALQMEGGSLRRAGLAGEDVHPADGGDGGQGLAPEPQSTDLPQVLLRPQLGGGVAQEAHPPVWQTDEVRMYTIAGIGSHVLNLHDNPPKLLHPNCNIWLHSPFHRQQFVGISDKLNLLVTHHFERCFADVRQSLNDLYQTAWLMRLASAIAFHRYRELLLPPLCSLIER